MFARLTTIKNNDEHLQSLVVSDSSDTDSLHPMGDKSTDDSRQRAESTASPAADPASPGFLDYPPRQGAPSPDTRAVSVEFSTPEKVEIQVTNESFIPVSHYTPEATTAQKMEIEVETVSSSDADYPRDAQLQAHEDADDNSDHEGPPSLLLPPPVQPTEPRRESHVRQTNRLLFKSLEAVYGNTSCHQTKEDEDDLSYEDESSNGAWSDSCPGPSSAKPQEPLLPTWHDCGEHPGMGWSLNDPLSSNYYKIIIPDPSISHRHLIVAPYVSYSLQSDQAKVSATYGKGYPIHMRTLTPTPVDYPCPTAMPDQLSLLTESPYAQAVT